MCDTYIPDIGYLCYECQDEFKIFSKTYIFRKDSDIKQALHDFMNTNKHNNPDNSDMISEYFKQYTS